MNEFHRAGDSNQSLNFKLSQPLYGEDKSRDGEEQGEGEVCFLPLAATALDYWMELEGKRMQKGQGRFNYREGRTR